MLKKIVLAVVAVAFSAGVASAQDAKLIEKGEKAFAANKCSMCHSIAGKGNAKGPLDGVGTKYTAAELREWLVNPTEMAAKHKATRKPMKKSYSNLPKEELDGLVAYMESLKKK
ncbi:MAG TPA: cytochrome c [Vicinamibacterales bacterium]|nr:cytochrome c [Vicinamibacterales bacterium]